MKPTTFVLRSCICFGSIGASALSLDEFLNEVKTKHPLVQAALLSKEVAEKLRDELVNRSCSNRSQGI